VLYKRREAIKALVLVDFIAEFTLASGKQDEDQGTKQWVVHMDDSST